MLLIQIVCKYLFGQAGDTFFCATIELLFTKLESNLVTSI